MRSTVPAGREVLDPPSMPGRGVDAFLCLLAFDGAAFLNCVCDVAQSERGLSDES